MEYQNQERRSRYSSFQTLSCLLLQSADGSTTTSISNMKKSAQWQPPSDNCKICATKKRKQSVVNPCDSGTESDLDENDVDQENVASKASQTMQNNLHLLDSNMIYFLYNDIAYRSDFVLIDMENVSKSISKLSIKTLEDIVKEIFAL